MTAPDAFAAPKKALAERGPSIHDGGAIQRESKPWQLYSGLMFAALMIGHHFSISAL